MVDIRGYRSLKNKGSDTTLLDIKRYDMGHGK